MNNKLGIFLHTTRLEKSLSLREFSEQLGISHAYLDKLEKGVDSRTGKDVKPTIDILINISNALQIETEDFFRICGYIK